MIIGITGTLGAGKTTIVEYLKRNGFSHYSVRDFLIEEIKRRDMPINRDSMVTVANDLRQKHSPSYIVEQIYEQAKGKDAVIESIRTPGEVKALKEHGDFMLLAIDAEMKTRYDRIIARQSETDQISFEKFKADEEREMQSDEEHKQNIAKCIDLSDHRIDNNGSIEDFYNKVEVILDEKR
ncbi:MAG: AAA family ATPase [Candidatus Woesearchaeota archaeon]